MVGEYSPVTILRKFVAVGCVDNPCFYPCYLRRLYRYRYMFVKFYIYFSVNTQLENGHLNMNYSQVITVVV